jgi:hypothetical protein
MATPSIEDLARQAKLIFRGTVGRLNAATMTAVPVTASTAVVTVDEVFQAPAVLGDLTGREITVQLGEARPAQPGDQGVFFANPWLYGEGIAVQEVDRRPVGRDAARVGRAVAGVVRELPNEALAVRVAAAEAVVAGTVVDNRPAAVAGSPRVTEHDPQWWEAVVAVESVAKGDVPQPTVAVLFARSEDVMWFQAPKLRVGQAGTWLLHRAEPLTADAVAGFAVVDPLDVQPRAEFERVQGLVQAQAQTQGQGQGQGQVTP